MANCLKSSVSFLARIVIAHGAAAHADHGKLARQQLLAGQVVERGNELAAGQVSGEAEDHHDAGIAGASNLGFVSAGRTSV